MREFHIVIFIFIASGHVFSVCLYGFSHSAYGIRDIPWLFGSKGTVAGTTYVRMSSERFCFLYSTTGTKPRPFLFQLVGLDIPSIF